jgi:predicted DNA-binding WGR domain protein
MLIIHRRDPDRRMARFYAVALQADLLAGWAVVREWGRIGSPGTIRVDLHQDLPPALAAAERMAGRKRGRGYR